MSDRTPRGHRRPKRAMTPFVEGLDARLLLSGATTAAPQEHTLGEFLNPGVAKPSRLATHTRFIAPRSALNDYLSVLLGTNLNTTRRRAHIQGVLVGSDLGADVVTNSFVRSVVSNRDTYRLLASQGMQQLLNYQPGGAGQRNVDTVLYTLPKNAVEISTGTSLVTVPPGGGLAGFFASVPTENIRDLGNGLVTVAVPLSQVPKNAPTPTSVSQGALIDAFAATGPLINNAIETSNPRPSPNRPMSVPGLRLVDAFEKNTYFPVNEFRNVRKLFRLAGERHLFDLTDDQLQQVRNAYDQFAAAVQGLQQMGSFTPDVPPDAPPLPTGTLKGTITVSNGAWRNLGSVAPQLSGLPIPSVGNFPGRIDVGVVFARNGDYGLVLTARGPLTSAPQVFTSKDVVGGDTRVEVSNATKLADLNGLNVTEGYTQGSVLSGSLANTRNQNTGVQSFAASVGYGAGFEFGTGISYTQVIPLGNAYALIPWAPKT